MSEIKFTPGPWKVTVSENGIDVGVDGLDGETITGWIEPYDAHLIAAAPELYETLEAIIARWDTPLWKDIEPTAVFINKGRAALAKARGET